MTERLRALLGPETGPAAPPSGTSNVAVLPRVRAEDSPDSSETVDMSLARADTEVTLEKDTATGLAVETVMLADLALPGGDSAAAPLATVEVQSERASMPEGPPAEDVPTDASTADTEQPEDADDDASPKGRGAKVASAATSSGGVTTRRRRPQPRTPSTKTRAAKVAGAPTALPLEPTPALEPDAIADASSALDLAPAVEVEALVETDAAAEAAVSLDVPSIDVAPPAEEVAAEEETSLIDTALALKMPPVEMALAVEPAPAIEEASLDAGATAEESTSLIAAALALEGVTLETATRVDAPARDDTSLATADLALEPSPVEASEVVADEPTALDASEAVAPPTSIDPTGTGHDIRQVLAALRTSDAERPPAQPQAIEAPAAISPASITPAAIAAAAIATPIAQPASAPIATPPAAPTAPAEPIPDQRAAVAYAARAAAIATPAVEPFHLPYEVRLAGIAGIIVAVSMLLGFLVSIQRTEVVAARTDVIFPVDSDRASGFLREDRRMLTHLEAIQSRITLLPIAEAEGMPIEDLEEQLHVEIVGGSEVIRIEVWDKDPARALRLTTGVASRYRSQILTDPGGGRAQDVLRRELQTLQGRITEMNQRLAELAPAIAGNDGTASERGRREAGQLETESQSTFQRIADVSARLDDLAVQNALMNPTATVAEPFVLPDAVRPRPLWDTALAGSVGAVIAGAVIAYLWWRRATEARLS